MSLDDCPHPCNHHLNQDGSLLSLEALSAPPPPRSLSLWASFAPVWGLLKVS